MRKAVPWLRMTLAPYNYTLIEPQYLAPSSTATMALALARNKPVSNPAKRNMICLAQHLPPNILKEISRNPRPSVGKFSDRDFPKKFHFDFDKDFKFEYRPLTSSFPLFSKLTEEQFHATPDEAAQGSPRYHLLACILLRSQTRSSDIQCQRLRANRRARHLRETNRQGNALGHVYPR